MLTDTPRADGRVDAFRVILDRSELIATSREDIPAELTNGFGDWSSRIRTLTITYGVSRGMTYA